MFSADLGGAPPAATPAATDPPFQKVALLLHGDGTNGAQNNTFVDSSTNNFTITRTGNVAQGTFSPFSLPDGQWSNYFDGSGDYCTVPYTSALEFGTSDFTAELWVYCTSYTPPATDVIVSTYQDSTHGWTFGIYQSISKFYFALAGDTEQLNDTSNILTNQWVHLCAVRSGTTLSFYVNGTRKATKTKSTNQTSTSTLTIGTNVGGGSLSFNGYISNLRVVKGTAVYDPTQSTLTVPTSALTAITNTSLLTCQSNRFKDNSSNNFTITRNGDTKVTAFSPFAPSAAYSASTNGGSGYFDGSGDYLYAPAITFGTSDFCVEFWCYTQNISNIPMFLWQGIGSQGWFLQFNASTLYFGSLTSNRYTTWSVSLTNNTWTHIAVTRSGSTLNVFINGVSATAKTVTGAELNNDYAGVTYIGTFSGTSYQLNGYISNYRVVVGSTVYTSNFTPPTAPLTAVSNTQLLLNCTNAGIIDNAGKNDIETVGNAQISTSVKKYGTGSMYFDGTGDWLLLADRPELQLGTGNFTVEGWLYLGATGATIGIVGKGTSTTGWLLSINSSNQVVFTYGSSTITSTGTLSGSTWYHIAVCREGTGTNQTKIYINGSNDGTGTVSTNFNQTNALIVGADRDAASTYAGYIDDLRITKGQALYTSNFTPPTQAFPNV